MPKSILCLQLRQLGDILLTTPCFAVLRKAFPDAHITFVTHRMGMLIVKDNPHLNEVITYREGMSFAEHREFLKKLISRSYDVVLDFMNNPRSALMSFLAKSPRKIAFRSARSPFYSDLVPKYEGKPLYIVEEKFILLKHLLGNSWTYTQEDRNLVLPYSEADRKIAYQLFASNKSLRIALSPTHRRPIRQWTKENFAKLSDWLVDNWNADIFWLWGPGEKEFVEEIASLCQHKTTLIPPTSFRELAGVIAQCHGFIGTSNGPSHVAVAVKTPSLQLHGPTRAASWCPETREHQSVQSPDFGEQGANCASIPFEVVVEKLEGMAAIFREKWELSR